MIAERCDYPLHLGVTETGTRSSSPPSASAAFAARYRRYAARFLTTAPQEIRTGRDILSARSARRRKACFLPCGRTRIDLIGLANKGQAHSNTLIRISPLPSWAVLSMAPAKRAG